jgi:hypothetical protein
MADDENTPGREAPTNSSDIEAAWEEALDHLEHGDAESFAKLLRSERPMPQDAREYLAELLSPETWILDKRLVVKIKGGAARSLREKCVAVRKLSRI